MNPVVPWARAGIAGHAARTAPGAKGGRPPFAVETILCIHFIQQWFNLSDPAMEEALYDIELLNEFGGWTQKSHQIFSEGACIITPKYALTRKKTSVVR